jgi:hypothetical protein
MPESSTILLSCRQVDLRSGDAHRIESDLRNAAASIMDGCKEVLGPRYVARAAFCREGRIWYLVLS